jgi:hypothetical protein
MKNPFIKRTARADHGRRAEKKAVRRFGGKATRASGALDFDKGDYEVSNLLVDSKATVHKSMSIKLAWLDKIRKEAQGKDKVAALHVQFTTPEGEPVLNGSWVLIPEGLLRRLLNESKV